jgi:hypothetical protein
LTALPDRASRVEAFSLGAVTLEPPPNSGEPYFNGCTTHQFPIIWVVYDMV